MTSNFAGVEPARDCLLEPVPKHSCQIPCQIVRNVTYMIHTFARAQIKIISLIELFPIDISLIE